MQFVEQKIRLNIEHVLGLSVDDSTSGKTLIMTTHTRNFDFLNLQAQQLQKHIKFPYTFIAGIDLGGSIQTGLHSDQTIRSSFENISQTTNTLIVEIPEIVHSQRRLLFPINNLYTFGKQSEPANRCAESLQYLLSTIPWWLFNSLLFIDGDMFPITDVPIPLVSEENIFRGVKQVRRSFNKSIEYFWGGYFWIHKLCPFHHLLSFQNGVVKGTNTDVGGHMSLFLTAVQQFGYPISFASHLPSGRWNESHLPNFSFSEELKNFIRFDNRNEGHGGFYSEIYDDSFFHYRAGGNWTRNSIDSELDRRKLLQSALSQN
jgi:hypothetical protein